MLIELMTGIGIFYYWTWFVWPFVFVYSLIYAILSTVKNEKLLFKSSIIPAISLLIILAGVISPTFIN